MDLAAQVDTLTNSIDNGPAEGVNGHAAVQYTNCLW